MRLQAIRWLVLGCFFAACLFWPLSLVTEEVIGAWCWITAAACSTVFLFGFIIVPYWAEVLSYRLRGVGTAADALRKLRRITAAEKTVSATKKTLYIIIFGSVPCLLLVCAGSCIVYEIAGADGGKLSVFAGEDAASLVAGGTAFVIPLAQLVHFFVFRKKLSFHQCDTAIDFISRLAERLGDDTELEVDIQLKGYEVSAEKAGPIATGPYKRDHLWLDCTWQLETGARLTLDVSQQAAVKASGTSVPVWQTRLVEKATLTVHLDSQLHQGARVASGAGESHDADTAGYELTLAMEGSTRLRGTATSPAAEVRTTYRFDTKGDESPLLDGEQLWSLFETCCGSVAIADYRSETPLELLPD